MHIRIITPTPERVMTGNSVTAGRWAAHLRALGHDVRVARAFKPGACDLLIALHARKSAASIERFASVHPDQPVVVALTGTDVYRDLATHPVALESLHRAWRIVTLQPRAVEQLPDVLHDRVRVIYQSVRPPARSPRPRADVFEVCVIGHLREVKDPFRAAEAVRHLPKASRIHVTHVGADLEPDTARRAEDESRRNARYRWLGPLPRAQALRVVARSRVMVLTSRMEGGANVVSEAAVCGTPVISSRIAGSIGLLGEDYPGYFEVADTKGLAQMLLRVETDRPFLDRLTKQCDAISPLFDPEREREAWRKMLASLDRDSRRP